MKKFTYLLSTLALILLTSVTKGQNNLNVVGGSDFYIQGSVTSGNLEIDLDVDNSANNDMNVLVSRDNSLKMNGHESYYCWFQCYDTSVSFMPEPITIPGRTTDTLSFHGYIYPLGHVGTSIITYTFWDQNNQGDTAVASLHYDVLNTSVNEITPRGTLSLASPNPANSFTSIGYSLPGLNDAHIVIYNMLGSTVKDFRLTSKQTLLLVSTTDIPSGIYIYSLINNGKPVVTKKLVVAHR